jgi:hypothetical protein
MIMSHVLRRSLTLIEGSIAIHIFSRPKITAKKRACVRASDQRFLRPDTSDESFHVHGRSHFHYTVICLLSQSTQRDREFEREHRIYSLPQLRLVRLYSHIYDRIVCVHTTNDAHTRTPLLT